MTKRLRAGKVLVDWSQNDEHKTTVTVYSVRARERPTVSTPVTWEEVQACRDARDPELLSFETGQVLARVAERGDLFATSAQHSGRSFPRSLSASRIGGPRWIRSQLRNRLLVATGMWKEATGEPLPRMPPGDPADQIQNFELQLVDRLWESANAENAREIADRTWDLVHDRPDDDPVKLRVVECHEALARMTRLGD